MKAELGIHRWLGEEGEESVDILVALEEEAAASLPVVREYRNDPSTIWDTETNEEFRGELEELLSDEGVASFERFLLARWMWKLFGEGQEKKTGE